MIYIVALSAFVCGLLVGWLMSMRGFRDALAIGRQPKGAANPPAEMMADAVSAMAKSSAAMDQATEMLLSLLSRQEGYAQYELNRRLWIRHDGSSIPCRDNYAPTRNAVLRVGKEIISYEAVDYEST